MRAFVIILFLCSVSSAYGQYTGSAKIDTLITDPIAPDIMTAPVNSLGRFLSFPIKSISITGHHADCGSSWASSVVYERFDSSMLVANKIYKGRRRTMGDRRNGYDTTFSRQITSKKLNEVLSFLNNDPAHKPSIKDFDIQASDIKKYIVHVNSNIKYYSSRHENSPLLNDKNFFLNFCNNMDTLSAETIQKSFFNSEYYCSANDWFTINVTNTRNDTIQFMGADYDPAWCLPWTIKYDNIIFKSYDVRFSKFIKGCIPSWFVKYSPFDNSSLIWRLADYVYSNK